MTALKIKTDLHAPEQLDTVAADLLEAVKELGPGYAVLELDGPEAQWAAQRLGLGDYRVSDVVLHLQLDGEK